MSTLQLFTREQNHDHTWTITLTALQIRTSEEILTLTRQMQELWLFGQLKTLEKSDVQGRIDGDAKEVAELLAKLVGNDEVAVQA